eukprot:3446470-Rhodomonas_salina.1
MCWETECAGSREDESSMWKPTPREGRTQIRACACVRVCVCSSTAMQFEHSNAVRRLTRTRDGEGALDMGMYNQRHTAALRHVDSGSILGGDCLAPCAARCARALWLTWPCWVAQACCHRRARPPMGRPPSPAPARR